MYWPVAKEISFKSISIFSSGGHIVQRELKILINLGRGHHDDYFCEITLNLDQWFKRRCGLKILLI